MPPCVLCLTERAALRRPKTGVGVCRTCFFVVFENEIHDVIVRNSLITRGERVAVGVSGGKDSAVLAHVLSTLNQRHDYGIEILLLAIDEGITGYRDDSLKAVRRARLELPVKPTSKICYSKDEIENDILSKNIGTSDSGTGVPPLMVLSYNDLYGWSMDEIVKLVGLRNNCTFCGVFRRQALDRGAKLLRADHIVTGHNADDIAETVLMNLFRGDYPRLLRCTSVLTQMPDRTKRSKPFKYTFQKEIVMYAYYKKLHYFSTECTYAPQSFRGHAREFLCNLVTIKPTIILDIIKSGDTYAAAVANNTNSNLLQDNLRECKNCGFMSSQNICKACVLLEGLNRGLPSLGIGKTAVLRRKFNLPEIES